MLDKHFPSVRDNVLNVPYTPLHYIFQLFGIQHALCAVILRCCSSATEQLRPHVPRNTRIKPANELARTTNAQPVLLYVFPH